MLVAVEPGREDETVLRLLPALVAELDTDPDCDTRFVAEDAELLEYGAV